MKKSIVAWLLIAALAVCGFACSKQDTPDTPSDADQAEAIATVGDVTVLMCVWQYQVQQRYNAIKAYKLDDQTVYQKYYEAGLYSGGYYDTTTDAGVLGLKNEVLNELVLQAAILYTAERDGFTLDADGLAEVETAKQTAADAITANLTDEGGSFATAETFLADAGLTEEQFTQMYVDSREASLYFNLMLANYKANTTLSDDTLQAGYEAVVKDTYVDGYTAGDYTKNLLLYLNGADYPSLYVPDGSIFVEMYITSGIDDEAFAALVTQAQTDFDTLFLGEDNLNTVHDAMHAYAISADDSLYDAAVFDTANTLAVGEIGSCSTESDGVTYRYIFRRVAGETGVVPMDTFEAAKEDIIDYIYGNTFMSSITALITDSSVTTIHTESEGLAFALKPFESATATATPEA